jgi:hypothetical protein
MQIFLFTFIAAFLLLSSLGLLIFYRQTTLRRLSRMTSQAAEASLLRTIAPERGSMVKKTRQAV